MFKTNPDSMRMEPTPERVLSVCRLVAQRSMTREEIRKAMQLDIHSEKEIDLIDKSISVALEELSLLQTDEDKLILSVDPSIIESSTAFRRYVSSRVFNAKNTTFFIFTQWIISQNEKIFSMRNWEGIAANCKKELQELSSLNENAVLGWRFWASFLGIGYLNGTMIIPNMKTRIEDVIALYYTEKFKYSETILAQDFLQWLSIKMPEINFSDKLPLAFSAGLRTLHELGIIKLEKWSDSVPIMLYPVDGDPIIAFTHISINEGMII